MSPEPSSHRVPAAVAGTAPRSLPAAETLARALAAADAAAVRFSARPGVVLRWLLAANVVLAAAGVALGDVVLDDPALYFRELMPGTLLSAAHILAAALVARAIHRRDQRGRRWYESFWGLSAVALAVLVVVELMQPTIYLSHWLENRLAFHAPAGIVNVDGLLVALLLAAVAAILAARALDVLRYPRAVALFAWAALLGATSQFLDATYRVSAWEFVLEDGAKALAGPFLVAGYLVVLGTAVKEQRTR